MLELCDADEVLLMADGVGLGLRFRICKIVRVKKMRRIMLPHTTHRLLIGLVVLSTRKRLALQGHLVELLFIGDHLHVIQVCFHSPNHLGLLKRDKFQTPFQTVTMSFFLFTSSNILFGLGTPDVFLRLLFTVAKY